MTTNDAVENSMKLFEPFYDIVNDSFEYARQWKAKSGQKVCGYFCSYGPEELIWASGVLPFRIFGTSGNISLADTHLQAYCCGLARGGLEDALSGKLNFLDGTVFRHTCDSIQRLSDIWRLNTDYSFHGDIVLPVKLNTQSARDYTVTIFEKFRQDLEKGFDVDLSAQKLADAIALFNEIRARLQNLYAIRSENPSAISGSDMHALVKASMMMDRSDLLAKLSELDQAFADQVENPKKPGKRLLLSGGLCNMPDVYQTIENAGGAVVGDDLCTGARYFEGQIEVEEDPIKAIAQRYADRVVCPAKHAGLRSRGEYLVNLARQNKADGVIFIMLKFCDPHAFDYPYLRDMLTAEGIPSTLFEIEDQQETTGQFRTRCEAFIEMI